MKRNSWITVLSVAITVGVLAFLIFIDPDVKNIGSLIKRLNPLALVAAFGCMMVFWLSEAGVVYIGCKFIPGSVSYLHALKVSFIGQYYSALTPFSSGGQPMQVAYMRRWDVPVASSSSIFAIKYLCWHIGISLAAILGLWYNWQMLKSQPALMIACIIGMLLNTMGVFAALLVMSKVSLRKPLLWIAKMLVKFRIVKDYEAASDGLLTWIEDFNEAMKLGIKHPLGMWGMLMLTFIQIAGYFSVTYCLYKGFGFSGSSWLYVALLQAVLTAAVAFVPLPGASGASEGAFYLLFRTIFSSGTTLTAMVVWRVFTYYSHLVIGSIISLYDGMRSIGRSKS